MTGTGTQTDPYLVDNWEDFVTAVSQSKKYVELTADIDMNDVAPEGITAYVSISCTEINGGGHIIKNLYSPTTAYVLSINYDITIKDLKFNDLYITAGAFVVAYWNKAANFNNCQFSGIFNNSYFAQNTCKFNRCGINLGGTDFKPFSIQSSSKYPILTNCNVNLDGTGMSVFRAEMSNSMLTGKFSGTGNLNLTSSSASVINAEITGFTSITDSSAKQCIINSDLCSLPLSTGAITQVTAEQLRNAEYLRSIGFPIGV